VRCIKIIHADKTHLLIFVNVYYIYAVMTESFDRMTLDSGI